MKNWVKVIAVIKTPNVCTKSERNDYAAGEVESIRVIFYHSFESGWTGSLNAYLWNSVWRKLKSDARAACEHRIESMSDGSNKWNVFFDKSYQRRQIFRSNTDTKRSIGSLYSSPLFLIWCPVGIFGCISCEFNSYIKLPASTLEYILDITS